MSASSCPIDLGPEELAQVCQAVSMGPTEDDPPAEQLAQLYQEARDANELLEFKNYELQFKIQELEQDQRKILTDFARLAGERATAPLASSTGQQEAAPDKRLSSSQLVDSEPERQPPTPSGAYSSNDVGAHHNGPAGERPTEAASRPASAAATNKRLHEGRPGNVAPVAAAGVNMEMSSAGAPRATTGRAVIALPVARQPGRRQQAPVVCGGRKQVAGPSGLTGRSKSSLDLRPVAGNRLTSGPPSKPQRKSRPSTTTTTTMTTPGQRVQARPRSLAQRQQHLTSTHQAPRTTNQQQPQPQQQQQQQQQQRLLRTRSLSSIGFVTQIPTLIGQSHGSPRAPASKALISRPTSGAGQQRPAPDAGARQRAPSPDPKLQQPAREPEWQSGHSPEAPAANLSIATTLDMSPSLAANERAPTDGSSECALQRQSSIERPDDGRPVDGQQGSSQQASGQASPEASMRVAPVEVMLASDKHADDHCVQCQLVRGQLERLEADKRRLEEQASELEELENDSRLMSQKLAGQLLKLEQQFEACKQDLRRSCERECRLKFHNERLEFELKQKLDTIERLQIDLQVALAAQRSARATARTKVGPEPVQNTIQRIEPTDGIAAAATSTDDKVAQGHAYAQNNEVTGTGSGAKAAEEVEAEEEEEEDGVYDDYDDDDGQRSNKSTCNDSAYSKSSASSDTNSDDGNRSPVSNQETETDRSERQRCDQKVVRNKQAKRAASHGHTISAEANLVSEKSVKELDKLRRSSRGLESGHSIQQKHNHLPNTKTSTDQAIRSSCSSGSSSSTSSSSSSNSSSSFKTVSKLDPVESQVVDQATQTVSLSSFELALEGVRQLNESDENEPFRSLIGEPERQPTRARALPALLLQDQTQQKPEEVRELQNEVSTLRQRLSQATELNNNLVYELERRKQATNGEGKSFGQATSRRQQLVKRRSIIYVNGGPTEIVVQSSSGQLGEKGTSGTCNGNNTDYYTASQIGEAHQSNELVEFLENFLGQLHKHNQFTYELANEFQRLALNSLLSAQNLAHHREAVMAGNEAIIRLNQQQQTQQVYPQEVAKRQQQQQLVYPVIPPPRRRSAAAGQPIEQYLDQQLDQQQRQQSVSTRRQTMDKNNNHCSIVDFEGGFDSVKSTNKQPQQQQPTATNNKRSSSALQVAKQALLSIVPIHYSGGAKSASAKPADELTAGHHQMVATNGSAGKARCSINAQSSASGQHLRPKSVSILEVRQQPKLVPDDHSDDLYTCRQNQSSQVIVLRPKLQPVQHPHHNHQQQQQQQPHWIPSQTSRAVIGEEIERHRACLNANLLDLLRRQSWCEGVLMDKIFQLTGRKAQGTCVQGIMVPAGGSPDLASQQQAALRDWSMPAGPMSAYQGQSCESAAAVANQHVSSIDINNVLVLNGRDGLHDRTSVSRRSIRFDHASNTSNLTKQIADTCWMLGEELSNNQANSTYC